MKRRLTPKHYPPIGQGPVTIYFPKLVGQRVRIAAYHLNAACTRVRFDFDPPRNTMPSFGFRAEMSDAASHADQARQFREEAA